MSLVVNMSFIYFELRLLTVLNIAVSNPVEQKKKKLLNLTIYMFFVKQKQLIYLVNFYGFSRIKYGGRTFQNWVTSGGRTKFFARKEGMTLKRGDWFRNGGVSLFLLLYRSFTFTLCVWEKWSFLYYISVLQSFELIMQDSHSSVFIALKHCIFVYFWSILVAYRKCRLLHLN